MFLPNHGDSTHVKSIYITDLKSAQPSHHRALTYLEINLEREIGPKTFIFARYCFYLTTVNWKVYFIYIRYSTDLPFENDYLKSYFVGIKIRQKDKTRRDTVMVSKNINIRSVIMCH